MVGANTTKPEVLEQENVVFAVTRPTISALKYYIHDGTDSFRFQLTGDLREADVKELSGCWATAKTTFGSRKLVLDLRRLASTDDSGKEWLLAMVREGATCLPESFFRNNMTGQQPSDSNQPRKAQGVFARLFSGCRGSRDIPEGSPTQAP